MAEPLSNNQQRRSKSGFVPKLNLDELATPEAIGVSTPVSTVPPGSPSAEHQQQSSLPTTPTSLSSSSSSSHGTEKSQSGSHHHGLEKGSSSSWKGKLRSRLSTKKDGKKEKKSKGHRSTDDLSDAESESSRIHSDSPTNIHDDDEHSSSHSDNGHSHSHSPNFEDGHHVPNGNGGGHTGALSGSSHSRNGSSSHSPVVEHAISLSGDGSSSSPSNGLRSSSNSSSSSGHGRLRSNSERSNGDRAERKAARYEAKQSQQAHDVIHEEPIKMGKVFVGDGMFRMPASTLSTPAISLQGSPANSPFASLFPTPTATPRASPPSSPRKGRASPSPAAEAAPVSSQQHGAFLDTPRPAASVAADASPPAADVSPPSEVAKPAASAVTPQNACELCKSTVADVECRKCEGQYCTSCFYSLHQRGPLQKHQPLPLLNQPKVRGPLCEIHRNELVAYCLKEHKMLCVVCLVREHQGHPTCSLADYYRIKAHVLQTDTSEQRQALAQQSKALAESQARLKAELDEIEGKLHDWIGGHFKSLQDSSKTMFDECAVHQYEQLNPDALEAARLSGLAARALIEGARSQRYPAAADRPSESTAASAQPRATAVVDQSHRTTHVRALSPTGTRRVVSPPPRRSTRATISQQAKLADAGEFDGMLEQLSPRGNQNAGDDSDNSKLPKQSEKDGVFHKSHSFAGRDSERMDQRSPSPGAEPLSPRSPRSPRSSTMGPRSSSALTASAAGGRFKPVNIRTRIGQSPAAKTTGVR